MISAPNKHKKSAKYFLAFLQKFFTCVKQRLILALILFGDVMSGVGYDHFLCQQPKHAESSKFAAQ